VTLTRSSEEDLDSETAAAESDVLSATGFDFGFVDFSFDDLAASFLLAVSESESEEEEDDDDESSESESESEDLEATFFFCFCFFVSDSDSESDDDEDYEELELLAFDSPDFGFFELSFTVFPGFDSLAVESVALDSRFAAPMPALGTLSDSSSESESLSPSESELELLEEDSSDEESESESSDPGFVVPFPAFASLDRGFF